MGKKGIIILFAALSFQTAQAWDVCSLKSSVGRIQGFTRQQLDSYSQNLDKECQLAQKYQTLAAQSLQNYGVQLTQISVFQSLRYVQRSFYTRAEFEGTPAPLIYQRYRANYSLPNSQKSREIWDNFQVGIQQLAPATMKIWQGGQFTVNDLVNVHRGFYTRSQEDGDYSHVPHPGEFKPESDQDRHWWRFKTDAEGQAALNTTQQINAFYRALGLPAKLDSSDSAPINQIVQVRSDASGYAIYSGDSRANKMHIQNLLRFLNAIFAQAQKQEPLIWNGQLLTPGQVAFFAQQFFVEVHPFYEGNGRTSRFIQELVLAAFSMPPGASGDLMDIDVLTLPQEYYTTAIDKSWQHLGEVQACLENEYPNAMKAANVQRVADIPAAQLSYKCQLVR